MTAKGAGKTLEPGRRDGRISTEEARGPYARPLGGVSAACRHGAPATTPVSYPPASRCALISRTRSAERATAPDLRGAVSDEAEEAKDQKDDHDRDD